MSLGFLNAILLLGLAGIAIPIIIHLLNRRRFEIIDWGAMQFLQISETTRRRIIIEEVLLMLMRMGLIALMVLALAAPYAVSALFSSFGNRPNRDVVFLFDGSYSMGQTGGQKTPHEAAKEWALDFAKDLNEGDSVVILQAKQQVVPVIGAPTHRLDKVRQAIEKLPEPRGGCYWPGALQMAFEKLKNSGHPQRDIIIFTDGQRYGWADESSLLRWELLAREQRAQPDVNPNIWVVNLSSERKEKTEIPNWTLAPIRASRAVASVNQEIKFRTALEIRGQDSYKPPYRIRMFIDGGQEKKDVEFPASAHLEKGRVPLSFTHRFSTPGSHLVSVVVEPDPPPDQRPAGYAVKDQVPGDNRQDYAIEVVQALPVLLVDGDRRPAPKQRGTDFLRDALAPEINRTPTILVKVVPIQDFTPETLENNLDKDRPKSRPRVLVLSNVARLTPAQQSAIAKFLGGGGSVLMTLGERVDAASYNEQLYRNGDGWLPAHIDQKAGDETDEKNAVSPKTTSFFHQALDLFRESTSGGLNDARFPRWWKVSTPGRNTPAMTVALLYNSKNQGSEPDPWFVERAFDRGRVMLCTVPLDNSWRSNLPDLLAFAPMVHELIYYLAGTRATEQNLEPGQPIRYRPDGDEPPVPLTLQPPEGEAKKVPVTSWPLVYENTQETGVYRLTDPEDKIVYYVVRADDRESDLKPCAKEDRDKVAAHIPMKYEDKRETVSLAFAEANIKQELWWWFMVGVVLLLCGEVWMTRRIVKNR